MNALKPRTRQPHVCGRCGASDVRVEHRADVVDFKGLTLEVAGLVQTACKVCGFTWTTSGQDQDNLNLLRHAYAARRDQVRIEEGLLTGEQIQFVLDELNLSKAEASALFGGGPNAFSKYTSGEVLQSLPMDRLIRLALAFGNHAVAYLRQGSAAPLYLYSGGFLTAPVAPAGTANPYSHASEVASPKYGTHVQSSARGNTLTWGGIR